MKDGICPKCKSEEVFMDYGPRHGINVPVNTITVHPTHLYVCTDCGYLEIYAQTGIDLEKAKVKFRKVKN
jgi:predicted nucleic-acid-binding Zn-ribbon protein